MFMATSTLRAVVPSDAPLLGSPGIHRDPVDGAVNQDEHACSMRTSPQASSTTVALGGVNMFQPQINTTQAIRQSRAASMPHGSSPNASANVPPIVAQSQKPSKRPLGTVRKKALLNAQKQRTDQEDAEKEREKKESKKGAGLTESNGAVDGTLGGGPSTLAPRSGTQWLQSTSSLNGPAFLHYRGQPEDVNMADTVFADVLTPETFPGDPTPDDLIASEARLHTLTSIMERDERDVDEAYTSAVADGSVTTALAHEEWEAGERLIAEAGGDGDIIRRLLRGGDGDELQDSEAYTYADDTTEEIEDGEGDSASVSEGEEPEQDTNGYVLSKCTSTTSAHGLTIPAPSPEHPTTTQTPSASPSSPSQFSSTSMFSSPSSLPRVRLPATASEFGLGPGGGMFGASAFTSSDRPDVQLVSFVQEPRSVSAPRNMADNNTDEEPLPHSPHPKRDKGKCKEKEVESEAAAPQNIPCQAPRRPHPSITIAIPGPSRIPLPSTSSPEDHSARSDSGDTELASDSDSASPSPATTPNQGLNTKPKGTGTPYKAGSFGNLIEKKVYFRQEKGIPTLPPDDASTTQLYASLSRKKLVKKLKRRDDKRADRIAPPTCNDTWASSHHRAERFRATMAKLEAQRVQAEEARVRAEEERVREEEAARQREEWSDEDPDWSSESDDGDRTRSGDEEEDGVTRGECSISPAPQAAQEVTEKCTSSSSSTASSSWVMEVSSWVRGAFGFGSSDSPSSSAEPSNAIGIPISCSAPSTSSSAGPSNPISIPTPSITVTPPTPSPPSVTQPTVTPSGLPNSPAQFCPPPNHQLPSSTSHLWQAVLAGRAAPAPAHPGQNPRAPRAVSSSASASSSLPSPSTAPPTAATVAFASSYRAALLAQVQAQAQAQARMQALLAQGRAAEAQALLPQRPRAPMHIPVNAQRSSTSSAAASSSSSSSFSPSASTATTTASSAASASIYTAARLTDRPRPAEESTHRDLYDRVASAHRRAQPIYAQRAREARAAEARLALTWLRRPKLVVQGLQGVSETTEVDDGHSAVRLDTSEATVSAQSTEDTQIPAPGATENSRQSDPSADGASMTANVTHTFYFEGLSSSRKRASQTTQEPGRDAEEEESSDERADRPQRKRARRGLGLEPEPEPVSTHVNGHGQANPAEPSETVSTIIVPRRSVRNRAVVKDDSQLGMNSRSASADDREIRSLPRTRANTNAGAEEANTIHGAARRVTRTRPNDHASISTAPVHMNVDDGGVHRPLKRSRRESRDGNAKESDGGQEGPRRSKRLRQAEKGKDEQIKVSKLKSRRSKRR